MKCLMNNKDVKHPCSPACALFGDCVAAFSTLQAKKAQTGTKPLHEELTANEELAYEQFKLQWMIDHGYTLSDLMECMEIMIHEDRLDGNQTKLPELFARWEFGVGFGDFEIWPCFEEYQMEKQEDPCVNGFTIPWQYPYCGTTSKENAKKDENSL